MDELALETIEVFDALLDTTRWLAEELLYRLQSEGVDQSSSLYVSAWEIVSGANEHTEAIEDLLSQYRLIMGVDDREL